MTGLECSAIPGALVLLAFLGLVPAIALLSRRLRPFALAVAPWAAAPTLALALVCAPDLHIDLPWLLLGARLGLDDTGRVFLFFTALLWLASGVFARGFLARDRAKTRFFACFLLAMTGDLGLVLALDMISFYGCFALMSFAAYGLIVHSGDAQALRAGRLYIYLVMLGEIFLIAALVLAALATGHLTFAAVTAALPASSLADPVIALTLAGFGIKAGALPLHVWLPLAHPAAPTPASAVLSGAMIKAGLLGWLRLLPAGQVALPGWGQLVLVLGLLAAFLAAAVGIVQRDPKAVLAYSSISQMGWMMLGLGIGLATPTAWPAVLTALQLFALHHALAKGALFLGVGVGSARGEHARFRAFVHTGLLLPALALAGAPWTTGAAAKSALHAATEAAPAPWPTWLHALLPLASLATGLLMARFLVLVWPPPRDAPLRLPASALAAWSVLWVIPLGVLWFAPIPAFRHAIRDTVSLAATWASLWPVLLAAAIAWRSARSPRARQLLARLSIPPGDLVVLVERATTALLARLRAVQAARRRLPRSAWTARLRRTALRCGDVAARGESIVARWTVGAVLFVILTALLAFLLHGDLDQTPPAATDLAPVEAPAAARPRRLPHRPARLRARQPGLHLAHAVRHRYVCSNMFI